MYNRNSAITGKPPTNPTASVDFIVAMRRAAMDIGWDVPEQVIETMLAAAPQGIEGELVEVGDDEEGTPRLIIHASRAAIRAQLGNLLFKPVVVLPARHPLHSPPPSAIAAPRPSVAETSDVSAQNGRRQRDPRAVEDLLRAACSVAEFIVHADLKSHQLPEGMKDALHNLLSATTELTIEPHTYDAYVAARDGFVASHEQDAGTPTADLASREACLHAMENTIRRSSPETQAAIRGTEASDSGEGRA